MHYMLCHNANAPPSHNYFIYSILSIYSQFQNDCGKDCANITAEHGVSILNKHMH